jgi:hypothetical protein
VPEAFAVSGVDLASVDELFTDGLAACSIPPSLDGAACADAAVHKHAPAANTDPASADPAQIRNSTGED